ncbi:signal peptidase I [Hyphomonas sp.]|uniref:signal peptidase I n=1 Tax=Hyphomonas sp. TaxID=87 RepID=UPI00391BF529
MSQDEAALSEAKAPATFWDKVRQELREWGATLAIVVPAFLLFTGLFYEQRVIPSESMVPSLEVSDRVAVAKFAYGYGRFSLPLSIGRYLPLGEGRFFPRTPKHGEVVVFEHPHTGKVMIKRVIGLPGDRVQILNEQLVLNGQPVEAKFLRMVDYLPHGSNMSDRAYEWEETVGDISWITRRGAGGHPVDDTLLFIVPEGHMFMMGDNRNNSLDSRELSGHCPPVDGVVSTADCTLRQPIDENRVSVGFVPLDHLIGRADTVLMSFYRCRILNDEPCKKRLWRGL